MRLLRLVISIFTVIMFLTGCSDGQPNHQGMIVERYIKIHDRSCIVISKNFDPRWRYGLPEVKVSGKESIVRKVVVNHSKHCVYISLDENNKLDSKMRIPLIISTSKLSYFSATGYSKYDIKLMDEKKFTIELSDHAHGSVAGIVEKAYIYTHNASSINARDLESNVIKIYSTGDTNIIVNATDLLDIKATGKTKINYLGNPEIQQKGSENITLQKI